MIFAAKSKLQLSIHLFTVAVMIGVGLSSPIRAAEFEALQLGFDGVGKVSTWLPIEAVVADLPASETVQLRAVFSDPRGDTCVEIVDESLVDANGRASMSGYFRIGRLEGVGQIQVARSSDGELICETTIAHGGKVKSPEDDEVVHSGLLLHRLDVPFLMTIGQVAGIEEFLRNAENFSGESSLLNGVQLSSLAQLPSSSKGLDGIDLLLLTDRFETTPAQATAIQNWVFKGGSLFVSAGKSVTALLESELGKWLGRKFGIQSEPINVTDLSPMQGFVSGSTVLQTNRESLAMAVINSDQNENDVASLDGTILATQSVGAGVVRVVAVDLNRKPLTNWPSLPEFYEVLFFGSKLSRQTTQASRTSRISQSGITDLATQMMATVDAVPESGRWSTWAIMAMIVVYLMLIGPADYFLVTHLLKRPHWTWITFPLLITCGAVGLYLMAGSENRTQQNQLHILDVVPTDDGSYARSQSWLSVSSAQTMREDLTASIALPSLAARAKRKALELTWSGRPEDIYGGIYRVGGIGLGRQSYLHQSAAPDTLSGVPLLTDGSCELFAEWDVHDDEKLITSDMSVSGYGLLRGTFSHSLPVTISDWTVMHGNRVYRTRKNSVDGALSAGTKWDAGDPAIYASDLKSYLNASRLVKDESEKAGNRGTTQVITPYDADSKDPVYVLTMATFYQVAGGAKYVGLSNSILGQVELSDTIRMNHAVLIGMADKSATDLSLGSAKLKANESKTIVRLLIPIDRRPSKGLAPRQE